MMPTTCHGWPLSVIVSPTMAGAAAEARLPQLVAEDADRGPLGASSSAVKLRPRAGRMPSVGKNVALTRSR